MPGNMQDDDMTEGSSMENRDIDHSQPIAGNQGQTDEGTPEGERSAPTVQEALEERRKIRRLQMMMDMVTSVIAQDESLTYDDAAEMIADSKRAALAMFPDKELAYNLIYKPRFQRLMRERFRVQ
jgi:hypothetical protein